MEPLPAGYTYWRERVTPEMQAWAHEVEVAARSHPGGGYGEILIREFSGVPVAARVEEHTWTTDSKGNKVPCSPICHGVSLLHPPPGTALTKLPTPTPVTECQRSPLDWLLVAATLTASGIAIYNFFSFRRRARAAVEENALDPDRPYVLLSPRGRHQASTRGDFVKLVFRAEHPNEPNERMWVTVTGDGRGKLVNKPVFLRRVRIGDTVTFERRHVAAVRSR